MLWWEWAGGLRNVSPEFSPEQNNVVLPVSVSKLMCLSPECNRKEGAFADKVWGNQWLPNRYNPD